MNCIVVDDSEMVQKQIAGFIEKSGFLTCCGTFANPIGMPQMSGFDFLDKYKKNIQIIVISASRKYALDAYDYDITDYLLKPIAYERFLVAANKAVEKHILQKHLNDEHLA